MEKIRAIRDRIEWFLVYAVIGWLYECIWCVMIDENGEFFNRGFLKGPWLPIYGFAMLIILFVIRKLKIKRPILIFLTGYINRRGTYRKLLPGEDPRLFPVGLQRILHEL